ncbi:MAG: XRE family transcriptional regulator [Kordiimonadaceae bacterium]|nr:XRE family transcriptional regulator [Kordiimonadaceae bacterium]
MVENNLRKIRKDRKLTLESAIELVERITDKSLSVSQLSRMERNIDGVTYKRLNEIANVYGVSVADIIGVTSEKVKVVGYVAAGEWQDTTEEHTEEILVPRPPDTQHYPHLVGLTVRGESMNLVFTEGTILYCTTLSDWLDAGHKLETGTYVIAQRRSGSNDFEATVKEYQEEDGVSWLVGRSTHAKYQSAIKVAPTTAWLDAPVDDAGAPHASITAVVIGAYQPFSVM